MNRFTRIVKDLTTSGDVVDIWWCPSIQNYVSGSIFTLNFVPSTQNQNTYPAAWVYEVSGITAIDSFISGNTGASTVTSLTVTNPSANTGTQNFVVGSIALSISATALNTPLTTLDFNWIPTGTNIAQFCHQIDTGSGGIDSAAWTWTTATRAAGALVSFKSNASTLVQTATYTWFNITPAQIAQGVQVPMTTPPTTGNALIVAWALGRTPNAPSEQVVSLTDNLGFVVI